MGRILPAACLLVACGRSPIDALEFAASGGGVDGLPQTCEEVDFLFVIDDSPSMGDNQSKLVENYDVFVGGILATVERLDSVHVGVVTTSGYAYNSSDCRAIGDLVVRTGGPLSSEAHCGPYAEGHAFMTEADDLADSFRCTAQVGTGGSGTESPLHAAIAATGESRGEPGRCNESFVREGALLVLVFVTDEDAEMDPDDAYVELVERKGGDPDDIVVVSLVNPPGGDCPLGGHSSIANGMSAFTSMFDHGFVGPICAQDYAGEFEQAVEVVRSACGAS